MGAENKLEKGHCFCPYCDEEIKAADLPWCQACSLTICYCSKCQKPVSADDKVCPNCGADIKG